MISGRLTTYRSAVLAVPEVNVVLCLLLLENDVRVAIVELSVRLFGLFHGLKLLDAVDFNRLMSGLLEEGVGFLAQLADVVLQVFPIEHVVVSGVNHRGV